MSVQSYYAISTGNCFVCIKSHEGVGIKAREVWQSIRNTKIRRKPYFQDYPDIVVTDIKKIPVFLNFCWWNTVMHTLAACKIWNTRPFVRFGSWRSEPDRNIPPLYKIGLLRIGVILFWGYNGFITDFTDFYWFSKKWRRIWGGSNICRLSVSVSLCSCSWH